MIHPLLSFLREIPKGRVVTYKYLATRFGIHPRAVASLLSKNEEQDVFPCYKVVHFDGKIGGYNLGVEEKIRRLENDGIVVRNNTVDRAYFLEK